MPAGGLHHEFHQISPAWAQILPSRFMRALLHHYSVELPHFSFNAISNAAIFVAVYEGYLGMRRHWEMWLYLFKGELFQAPTWERGVRKTIRVGCLNLVLKTCQGGSPESSSPLADVQS